MGENKQLVGVVALVGVILIGLGVFYLKTSDSDQEVQILAAETEQLSDKEAEAVKMNINTASQSELESLPGIGPSRGQKIIEGRPYKETKELLIKKIVGRSIYEQISARIGAW